MKVRDIMSKPVITINHDSSLRDAARKMSEHGIGFLVVLKNGELYGVISERDIVKVIALGKNPDDVKVGDVCTKTVVTIREDESPSVAAKLMRLNRVRHLVVVDQSLKPVGVLSIRDLVREEKILQKIEAMRPEEFNEWWFG